MGVLQTTLFIIALLTLLAQTVRHVYVKWVEPTRSVLDKYESPAQGEIKKASSLGDLVKQYDEARKKIPEDENPAEYSATISRQKAEAETLRGAIQAWEDKTKQISELRFFWGCGLVLLLLGLLLYKQQYLWLGLTVIITGISEMIWWTSPSFRWGGGSIEFDKLLTNKIAFSLASIILLLITGHVVERLNFMKMKL
jgi:hypothetical protein